MLSAEYGEGFHFVIDVIPYLKQTCSVTPITGHSKKASFTLALPQADFVNRKGWLDDQIVCEGSYWSRNKHRSLSDLLQCR